MDDNFVDLLADNSELFIDNFIENEVVQEIPILGNAVKLFRGVVSIRDKMFFNKIKYFVEHLGTIDEEKREKLRLEVANGQKSRIKFGDVLLSTIEQAESIVKVEYLSIVFEAFLNNEITNEELKQLCHIIKNCLADDLVSIIEDADPKSLKYAVTSGLAANEYLPMMHGGTAEPRYHLSHAGTLLKNAYLKYSKTK